MTAERKEKAASASAAPLDRRIKSGDDDRV